MLADFIAAFDFLRMRPDDSVVKAGVPEGVSARALVEPGRQYAVYLRPFPKAKQWQPAESLAVDLPSGSYRAEWINVLDGTAFGSELFQHAGGAKRLAAPQYVGDVAVRITRSK